MSTILLGCFVMLIASLFGESIKVKDTQCYLVVFCINNKLWSIQFIQFHYVNINLKLEIGHIAMCYVHLIDFVK